MPVESGVLRVAMNQESGDAGVVDVLGDDGGAVAHGRRQPGFARDAAAQGDAGFQMYLLAIFAGGNFDGVAGARIGESRGDGVEPRAGAGG